MEEIDITNFLPHRSPFLMVDKILSISNNRVITRFKIKQECVFVENNIFSEVGLIENAAQTCSSIVGQSYFDEGDTEGSSNKLIGFISTIKNVIVWSCPKVETILISEAKLLSSFDTDEYKISTILCVVYEGEKELLSCKINLFIREIK
jgi:predicted hotdog family 3-hydroxylacyl-ACP dehydratase